MATQHQDPGRYILNRFTEIESTTDIDCIKAEARNLQSFINDGVRLLTEKLPPSADFFDGVDLYTGAAGISALFLHLHQLTKAQALPPTKYHHLTPLELSRAYMDIAVSAIVSELQQDAPGHVGHRCGIASNAGVWAVAAAVYYEESGELELTDESLMHFKKLEKACYGSKTSDELLYGRIGYLAAYNFLLSHLPSRVLSFHFPEPPTNRLIDKIVTSGANGENLPTSAPLRWAWHDRYYLGAAYGTAGILAGLLKTPYAMQTYRPELEATARHLRDLQTPTGNWLSADHGRQRDEKDELVQWCHGAPGVIHTMILSHQRFHDASYLDAALKAGELVWKKGLLRKGVGLCHGISGNAYAFIDLYHATGDPEWMRRALHFACVIEQWQTLTYAQHELNEPDHPYSLFEGLAGALYFAADLVAWGSGVEDAGGFLFYSNARADRDTTGGREE
ncbi:uncharacterized protein EV422DRAFT_566431 [Fimicolochytrium jonesii]|uniref:uncharacterized protein n=1 Tax=Fimicolochytrium jonesii TaxID=1396493 RepID=UPI0022FE17D6|nr:uncharacterized protein EV422DRAFT_566431 [Fimicolochytrium jonesii]KAI8822003.1 hypothetical protein EV422DRAFT_566431 [Fimicolochytrium jonesii]